MPTESEAIFHDLRECLNSSATIYPDKNELSSSERQWREVTYLAETKGWRRPFAALISMSQSERENIRQTLCFEWAKETTECSNTGKRSELESWEIIDCNIRGVAARLHTISEQLKPDYYLTWRGALTRILEMLNRHYKATEHETALEQIVHDALCSNKHIGDRHQTEIPSAVGGKVGKSGGMVVAVLKDVAEIWDDVLGSEDTPAVATVYAICAHLHPLPTDNIVKETS